MLRALAQRNKPSLIIIQHVSSLKTGVLQEGMVRSLQQVWGNIDSKREQVVDARSAGRWEGSEPEPRPDLPSGHIPGSLNLPFPDVLQDGR